MRVNDAEVDAVPMVVSEEVVVNNVVTRWDYNRHGQKYYRRNST